MRDTGLFAVWRRRLLLASVAIGWLIIGGVGADAQSLYGSLVGNVVDGSGGIIPGATVVVTHKETNQSQNQVTPASGAYSFPNLPPGTYDVQVTLPGFRTFQSQDVVVRVGAIVRVDATLEVGALEETIVVTSQAAILQTDSAVLQGDLTAKVLEDVPISERSYQSLLELTPR